MAGTTRGRSGEGGGPQAASHRAAPSRSGNGRQRALGEYQSILYGSRQDYEGMVDTAKSMVDRTGAGINALVLKSDNLARRLRGWTPKQYALKVKKRGGKTVLDLEKRGEAPGSGARRISVAIAEIQGWQGHYCAVSDCKAAEFKDVFMGFVYKYSPHISRMFLTSDDMKGMLARVESGGYDVATRHASTANRQGAGTTGAQATSAGISNTDYFRRANKGGSAAIVQYLAKSKALNGSGAQAVSCGTVARDCRFSATAGTDVLFDLIIPGALSASLERNSRLEASAKSAGGDDVEPTVVRFDKKIFESKRMNRRYVAMIARMPDSSISAYDVNPHIYLSLVDYTDGSSYDIWVLSHDKITIIPQIRASGASLKRLVNYIFECMGEGHVEKYEGQ